MSRFGSNQDTGRCSMTSWGSFTWTTAPRFRRGGRGFARREEMRKMMIRIACGIAAIGASMMPAFAQDDIITFVFGMDPRWISLSNKAVVEVDDQVKDGCWTNANAAKNAVALELQRNGYTVGDDLPFPLKFIITGVGYRASFGCVVNYDLAVWAPSSQQLTIEGHTIHSLFYDALWTSSGVMSGSETNSRLKETFVEHVQSFLVRLPQAKREVIEEAIKRSPDEAVKAYWRSKL